MATGLEHYSSLMRPLAYPRVQIRFLFEEKVLAQLRTEKEFADLRREDQRFPFYLPQTPQTKALRLRRIEAQENTIGRFAHRLPTKELERTVAAVPRFYSAGFVATGNARNKVFRLQNFDRPPTAETQRVQHRITPLPTAVLHSLYSEYFSLQ